MHYTEPLLSVVFIVGMLGALRLPKSRGRRLVIGAMVALLLVSWPPLDWLFSRPLEAWYPIRPLPPASADAIVVLGSSVETPHYERPFPLADHDTYSRCRFAAWLHRNWRPLPILACGGGAKGRSPAFAASMRDILTSVGVPDSSIWTEERSRTTYENALYGAQVLRSHGVSRIALVVEAQSMLRASACFRKQGIEVVPAPNDFEQLGPWADEVLLGWKAVRRNEITCHEMLGLVWYKLHGWI
jgi:uncharacterized SAM-binding protein YcdF (DUF218 family)